MVLDYVALADWGLVPALGVLTTLTVTSAYSWYYKKILNIENDVKNKVRDDVTKKVNNFNEIASQNQQGEQEFANQISRIAKFKEIVNDSKNTFRKHIAISAIILILSGIAFIVWTDKQDAVMVVGLGSLAWHLMNWYSLMTNYGKIERFMNGEEPKDILGE